jgi:hypothetical protein
MSVEIGTEAAQFPEKEYINGIFVAVCRIMFLYVPMLMVSFALCAVIYLPSILSCVVAL